VANDLAEWPSWLGRPLKSELLSPRDFHLQKLESDSAEPGWLIEYYADDLLTSLGRPPARSLSPRPRQTQPGSSDPPM
jgi:hypothetical protein